MGKKKVIKDVGDEAQVKKSKSKFKNKEHIDRENLKVILQNYHVRALVWRILSECGMYDFGYCGDNNMLNHKEGKRAIGGWLIDQMLTADAKSYTIMRDEAVSRDTTEKGE